MLHLFSAKNSTFSMSVRNVDNCSSKFSSVGISRLLSIPFFSVPDTHSFFDCGNITLSLANNLFVHFSDCILQMLWVQVCVVSFQVKCQVVEVCQPPSVFTHKHYFLYLIHGRFYDTLRLALSL